MRAIINFGRGKWYPRGTERLHRSLMRQGYRDAFLNLADESQFGAPSHEQSPYAFKPALFKYALLKGFQTILWADSSIFAIGNLEPVFRHIEEHGHIFFANGCVGEWSSDAALNTFNMDREEAMGVTELTGCLMGLDLNHERSRIFLAAWLTASMDGVTFPGPWNNDERKASADPRVKGHRHDQTAASIIAYHLDMVLTSGLYFQYFRSPSGKAWSESEPNDMSLTRSDTVLCNQGM